MWTDFLAHFEKELKKEEERPGAEEKIGNGEEI